MHVKPIDPRDIQWEENASTFRVTFWRRHVAPRNVPSEFAGYEAREFEVADADIRGVLTWAQGESLSDETFTLHLLVRCPDLGLGRILIAGTDPTATD